MHEGFLKVYGMCVFSITLAGFGRRSLHLRGVENSKEKFLRINRNSSKSNLKCVSREVEMLKIKG